MATRYLSAQQAADYLGYCADHVRRLRRKGLLEGCTTPTGRVRFTKAQLDRFLRKAKVEAPTEGTA